MHCYTLLNTETYDPVRVNAARLYSTGTITDMERGALRAMHNILSCIKEQHE